MNFLEYLEEYPPTCGYFSCPEQREGLGNKGTISFEDDKSNKKENAQHEFISLSPFPTSVVNTACLLFTHCHESETG